MTGVQTCALPIWQLTENQRARVASAYRAAGAAAVDGYRRVLLGLINDVDRARLSPPPAGNTRKA